MEGELAHRAIKKEPVAELQWLYDANGVYHRYNRIAREQVRTSGAQ